MTNYWLIKQKFGCTELATRVLFPFLLPVDKLDFQNQLWRVGFVIHSFEKVTGFVPKIMT